MQVECYAASRPQQGKAANEDAFAISREPIFSAVLCDGAGDAERAAKKVLALFEKLLREATPAQLTEASTWAKWIKVLDSSLLGSSQTTFVGVAIVGSEAIGVSVGDSRAYLLNRDGELRILTEGASKNRLGSGKAQPFHMRQSLAAGEILLLLSDGAWTPLNPYFLKKAILGKQLIEVPTAILEAASRTGRADDQTALALRLH